jgi:purine-binding chemotaxis protein CheW
MSVAPQRYCTFAVGELRLGIEAERVREILLEQELTPVPRAHPSVLGLLNLRGRIVTAIDARHRLGLPTRDPEAEIAHVITWGEGEAVSLVVDSEREVVEVDTETRQQVPETVRPEIRSMLTAVYEVDARELLLVLDPDRATSITTT